MHPVFHLLSVDSFNSDSVMHTRLHRRLSAHKHAPASSSTSFEHELHHTFTNWNRRASPACVSSLCVSCVVKT